MVYGTHTQTHIYTDIYNVKFFFTESVVQINIKF